MPWHLRPEVWWIATLAAITIALALLLRNADEDEWERLVRHDRRLVRQHRCRAQRTRSHHLTERQRQALEDARWRERRPWSEQDF